MSLILRSIFFLCLVMPALAYSQDKVLSFPGQFINGVQEKASKLEAKLQRQTKKYLLRLAHREQKLKKHFSKLDSNAAAQLFSTSEEQYSRLADKLSSEQPAGNGGMYLPGVDSVKTALAFLQQNIGILPNIKNASGKVNGSLDKLNQVQSKLRGSEQIKTFIQNRQQLIRNTFSKYGELPKKINKSFAHFSKDFYYYQQQVKEYRELLNDPDRMIQKGLEMLSKTDAFKKFMQQHSELAALFRLPDNYSSSQALNGLQTRSQVQQLIQTQLSSVGPNASQVLQQNIQAAQAQVAQLKDKLSSLGSGGGADMDMPDFKPNNQRTKSFLRRLEYGLNVQSAKSTYFFPVTTDVGLSVGYKLNDKSIIGIGASYKAGWGKDIRHIVVTNEGLGLRSFVEVKLKGSFYASGGFEYNYQKPFGSLSSVIDLDTWQQSGLAGISKIVSVKSKFFKKTKLQLLWDFLSYQQTPRSQPVKFRVGYNF